MDWLTVIIAFAAGALSFLSPCVFPLIPAYISHITGSSIQNNKFEVEKRLLLVRSISFIIGFSTVFIAMGASATMVGRIFVEQRELVQKLSGLLIMTFGMQMIGWLQLQWFMTNKSWDTAKIRSTGGMVKSFLTGLAFGSGWTPCVGLALSSILLMAGSSETLWIGILMLAIYSLGLGIPFIFISLVLTYSTGIIKKLTKYVPVLSKINGFIFLGLGLLLFTGQLQKVSAWLARYTLFDITF